VTPKSCKSWDQHDVRYLEPREDARGNEIHKEVPRPWAILSDRITHQGEIFIGCPSTSAGDRSFAELLVPGAPGGSAIDVQQPWTFPAERQDSSDKLGTLPPPVAAEVSRRLADHLHVPKQIEDSQGAMVGHVVWVDLLGPKGTEAVESDLFAIQRTIKERSGYDWTLPRSAQLSCLCIASDEYLRTKKNVFSLATLVPLMHIPGFQQTQGDNPTVTVPRDRGPNGGQVRSALTQCLMTIDYQAQQKGNKTRVYRGGEGMKSWRVTRRELRDVIDDVLRWLLLPLTPAEQQAK
jgi:hypothetical protein